MIVINIITKDMKSFALRLLFVMMAMLSVSAGYAQRITTTQTVIYDSPKPTAKAIGSIPKGTQVHVHKAKNGAWSLVSAKGKTGYVLAANLGWAKKSAPADRKNSSAKEKTNKKADRQQSQIVDEVDIVYDDTIATDDMVIDIEEAEDEAVVMLITEDAATDEDTDSDDAVEPVLAEEPEPVVTDNHEYVDLALPSGTLWATCNVGASSPEGSGDYFAWGETSAKTVYAWSTYKLCNGSATKLTKYSTQSTYGVEDYIAEIEAVDDAATYCWGPNWCMPTRAQQDELRDTNNCTWAWTTHAGKTGYRVTSKRNGNYIFLPAVGYRTDTVTRYQEKCGYYLSRTLSTSASSDAYYLMFDSDDFGWDVIPRYSGCSVRAVRK